MNNSGGVPVVAVVIIMEHIATFRDIYYPKCNYMSTIPFVSVDRKTLEIVDRFFRQSVDEEDYRSSDLEHIQVPDHLNVSSVKAVKGTTQEIILVENETITLPTANELLTEEIRIERNNLLQASDKYILDDWPHASPDIKTAWVEYRRALRDMATIAADPENPKWPTQPSL